MTGAAASPVDPNPHPHPLDNLIWDALTSRQAGFALGGESARRFRSDVAPFAAIARPDDDSYAALADLVEEHGQAVLFTAHRVAPDPSLLTVAFELPLTQMIVHDLRPPADDLDVIELGPEDVPEMIALVESTRPGPYKQRTIQLGRYIGIRQQGQLVAMGGERLKPEGFTEISAVCTHPDWRGRGYASGIVSRMAQHIQARGDTAILHTGSSNTTAISVYRHLGFKLRRELYVTAVEPAVRPETREPVLSGNMGDASGQP